ncbi:Uncharacterized protein GBIM_19537 [Gryllus bimaculatus]|nr:Uncharacterized protein GBIM_19537 [Gryllus bimaculatus]
MEDPDLLDIETAHLCGLNASSSTGQSRYLDLHQVNPIKLMKDKTRIGQHSYIIVNWADGKDAASLNVAEQYVQAFQNLAKTSNTLILPNNTGDVSNAVVQAMSIYKKLSTTLNPESQSTSSFSHEIPELIPSTSKELQEKKSVNT